MLLGRCKVLENRNERRIYNGQLYKVIGERKFKQSSYDQKIYMIMDIAKNFGITRLVLLGSYSENPERAKVIELACEGIDNNQISELAAKLQEEVKMPVNLVDLSNLADSKLCQGIKLL